MIVNTSIQFNMIFLTKKQTILYLINITINNNKYLINITASIFNNELKSAFN